MKKCTKCGREIGEDELTDEIGQCYSCCYMITPKTEEELKELAEKKQRRRDELRKIVKEEEEWAKKRRRYIR